MPGYFIHLVAAPEEIRNSKLGALGLIAPDFWQKYAPTEEEYIEFFQGCEDFPTYEQILMLCSKEHGGTHFGVKSRCNTSTDFGIINQMIEENKIDSNNMFIKGFIQHLKVDEAFYTDRTYFDVDTYRLDYAVNNKKTIGRLHKEWDRTNLVITKWYPEAKNAIHKLPERACKVIAFTKGKLRYVNLEELHEFIEKMRI